MAYRYAVMARCREEGAIGVFYGRLFHVESSTPITDRAGIIKAWFGEHGQATGKPRKERFELWGIESWWEVVGGEGVKGKGGEGAAGEEVTNDASTAAPS